MAGTARQWVAPSWGAPETWRFLETPVRDPGPGEVTIRVRAAGVNPADAKHVAAPRSTGPAVEWPVPIGYEVSGEIVALGPGTAGEPVTRIGSGPAALGDEVIAFRVRGGYASALTIPAAKAFRKPAGMDHPAAANLLLAGTTAAEMLAVTEVSAGDLVLLHGASGSVGMSALQQARRIGAVVIGTSSAAGADRVRRFGGHPVVYGPGLIDRVRTIAAEIGRPLSAAWDAVGTDEAVEASLALVQDRARIVTIAAADRASAEGFRWIAGSRPDSARFRDDARGRLVELAERGGLEVPVSRTFPLAEAPAALRLLAQGHPGGAFALIP